MSWIHDERFSLMGDNHVEPFSPSVRAQGDPPPVFDSGHKPHVIVLRENTPISRSSCIAYAEVHFIGTHKNRLFCFISIAEGKHPAHLSQPVFVQPRGNTPWNFTR